MEQENISLNSLTGFFHDNILKGKGFAFVLLRKNISVKTIWI